MNNTIQVVQLDHTWKDRVFVYRYQTEYYYDVQASWSDANHFCFSLSKQPFAMPVEKRFEGQLFSEWLIEPMAYGAFRGETLLGVMSLAIEDWNQRLRVAELWVDEPFRFQGVGKTLMAKAIAIANEKQLRGLVLETQSCNEPAIRFYLSCGFRFIGLDTTHYSNSDITNREVRIEMGLDLSDPELNEK